MREDKGSLEFIEGIIIDKQKEKEPLHIIEELKGIPIGDNMEKAPDKFELMNKINEIIREVNKMMRDRKDIEGR